MRRPIYIFIIFLIILLLFAGGLVSYILFTTRGSSDITRFLLSDYVETESVNAQKVTGSLSQTLIFENIEFDNLAWLPPGSLLKIQRLELFLSSFSLEGLNAKIYNGRLNFPDSEAILFYGDCQNGAFDLTVYADTVSVGEALDLFAENALLERLSGTVRNIDIKVGGSFFEPELNGNFHLEDLARDGFSMTNCPGTLSLKLTDLKEGLKLYGHIVLAGGIISGPKTAIVNLQKSKILFNGDPKAPLLEFRGTSRVEDVKISLTLQGGFDNPDLKLASQPSFPQERLLTMLATGKSWSSAEGVINKGELSVDLAKDFLDYFVFSDPESKMMQQVGVRNLQIKYDDKTKGIGATKDITDKAAATYFIEQPQGKQETPTTTHRVGGEYKITESISIGAEKELKQDSKTGQALDKQQTDDKVTLKFKKEF